MKHDTIYVCTFQRGGSTLVMHMLAAAGCEMWGKPPAYEPRAFTPSNCFKPADHVDAWRVYRGRCVKMLDPLDCRLDPDMPGRAIWLDRDPRERARSAVKFLQWQGMPITRTTGRGAVRGLASGYRRDRAATLACLRRSFGERVLIVKFEDLIGAPWSTALQIASFAGCWPEQPEIAAVMAGVVKLRTADCLPYMLEETMTVPS